MSEPSVSCHPELSERRSGARDRRARLWHSLMYGGLNPRRRTGRRTNDHHRPIVDWHGPGLFASSVLILVLCVLDAFLTLRLLSAGARETNPVMALYAYSDAQRFAILKLSLTGLGVLMLVALARFRVFRVLRAATLVHAVLAGYVALVGYEFVLLDRVG
jgi:hypothetical protein